MDISARTMYGLRALLTLASARTDEPMSIQAIADEEQLPAKFLEGIMADLKRGGFVVSRRGASGGYRLVRPASEVTLLEVIRHLDGPVAPVAFDDRCAGDEPTERQQALKPVWLEVRRATVRVLESYTLQSVADGVPEIVGDEYRPIYQI